MSSCSSFDCNPCDIEEQLEQFFIRKKSEADSSSGIRLKSTYARRESSRLKIHDHIPLRICDILQLEKCQILNTENLFKIFGVSFKSCLIHARVVGRARDNNHFYKYIIDDGTAIIELSIYRCKSDFEALMCLEAEVNAFETMTSTQNKKEISSCLRRLLATSKLEIDKSSIPMGYKILVHGKPAFYRGQVSIDAFSLAYDQQIGGCLEIEYKDLLINWYTSKYCKYE